MDRQHLPTFYAGALQQGLRFVKLKPRTKESVGSWESSILPSVPAILASLDQGFNVGFLLQSKDMSNPNPLGVWGLDIDTQEAATRFPDAPFNLSVSRGHAFKRHYFALLPDPAAPRHSRNIRKSHDVKLTGILVAPGSTHQEGGIYSPEIRDPSTGLWVPWDGSPIDWASLSVVDPSPYMPLMTRLLPLSNKAAEKAAQSVSGEWVFASNQDASKWEDRPFSQAKGTLKDRTYRGESYVRNRLQCGIVSKSGDGGRATLLVIVTHLLQYLMLPDDVVMDLLVKPVHGTKKDWNSHCIDARTKAPYPWSEDELRAGIKAARQYVPYYGWIEYQRLQALEDAKDRLWHFWTVLRSLPSCEPPIPTMSAQDLYKTFLDLYSLAPDGFSYRRFTLAMQTSIRAGVVRLENIRGSGRKKLRHYRGINARLIDLALELAGIDSEEVA